MGLFRVISHPARRLGTLPTALVAMIVLVILFLVQGQSFQEKSDGAVGTDTLQGTVQDSRGRPIVGATVYVQLKGETETRTTLTDSAGNYRFPALREGVYVLRAEMAGYAGATHDPIVLRQKDAKSIDLTLSSANGAAAQSSTAGSSATGKPEFFDEPAFTVAGVTDTTNLGGHGSNTIVRSKESLAREAAALSNESRPSASSIASTENNLRDAAERQPENFEANHRLGELLVNEGKSKEALPYLEQASRLNGRNYENTFLLARAYAEAAKYDTARTTAQTLLTVPNKSGQEKAELHHLLGDVAEKQGNPLEAVQEYQRAAELNPSEANLFDWGAELLLHRAAEPAIEVFTKGNRLFPRSVRMLVGLGVAWYARGSYNQAARRLCEASDLNPDEATPYLFLGKMQAVETTQSEGSVERLGRFARLQPEDALANYYYAVSLWRRRKGPEDADTFAQVESLLQKAVRLDPKLGAGYLQLGILYSERKDFPKAISAYQKAIEASPQLAEAH